MLIHVCVSCVSWECLQYVCVCVCLSEHERDRKEGRDRKREGVKAYPRGSNLNHRIFLTLRASG